MAERDRDQKSGDALFARLQGWFKADYDRQESWRRKAREDYAFTSGEQLNEEDKALLRSMNRPIIIMNRIEPVIDSVAGSEVANRQEVQFLPRTQGDVHVNEVLTSAAKWFRDQCDAEDEESDAFRDAVICGMGWTETRLDYEEDPTGAPLIERVDPLEMVWDASAKKRNLVDGRRLFHIRRDIPIEEARALIKNDKLEDSDYNATWVDDSPDGTDQHHTNPRLAYGQEGLKSGDDDDDDKTVTMVRAQWWERVPSYLVADPTDKTGQNTLNLSEDEFEDFQKKLAMAGAPVPKFTKGTKKVFRQAFLGKVLLEQGDAPCKDHFSFTCITGKRDRNRNSWYGLVRAMKDPQRWANKWMAQTMHIMNTSAKGGIAVERGGFFDNDLDGEASWAKQDAVTYLKQGALSGGTPKMMPKPVSQFPQSSFELMQFAISSIRDTSGVNVELLGMSNNQGQAAELDRQRKQSAMTILQPLFDSLRRYRKEQGRMLLYLIQHYLSDGRLIKIVGQEGAQYVPLMKQDGVTTYDVIVDESPTSANQQEATWSMLQQILPVIGKMLPPATWLALLKYSPLPTSAQDDIRKSMEQAQSQPDPEQQKRDAELKFEQQKTEAKIASDQALTKAKIDNMHAEHVAKTQLEMHKAANQSALQAQQQQADQQQAAAMPDQLMQTISQLQQSVQALTAALTGGGDQSAQQPPVQ